MRLFWPLIAGAGLLAIAALSATIALHSGGNPGTAEAITPTPIATPSPLSLVWDFRRRAPSQVVAGGSMNVSVVATIAEPDILPPGVAGQASYWLERRDKEPVLEIVSPGKVPVLDVLDGAEWELRGLRPGRAVIAFYVSIVAPLCDECEPSFKTIFIGGRAIEVMPRPGDVDCNTTADSIDAALILQFAAALVGELPCQDVADVNDDGSVDALDATLILQFAAGLLDSL